jgi:hypothetical protein
MSFFHNLAFNGDTAMRTITVLARADPSASSYFDKVLDPMTLQVVSMVGFVLPRLLLISKSNSRPAILTIWQDLRDDGDQEIVFIILGAQYPRHDGTSTNKQRPGNHQI